MTESSDITLESINIISKLLSDNAGYIFLAVVMIVFREAISGFISRLVSLSYKNGDSSLGLQAVTPREEIGVAQAQTDSNEESIQNDIITHSDENLEKGSGWFSSLYNAFLEDRFEDAERIFKEYAVAEKNQNELLEKKAYYLFCRHRFAKDESAIQELENLCDSIKSEESKFSCLEWLSFCLLDSLQYEHGIGIWSSFINDSTNENIKTKAIINIAHAISKTGNPNEAKLHLTNRLLNIIDKKQESILYRALSEVEKTLGNSLLSVYCKDKSLEFDANNRGELFQSAYTASNEDAKAIAISNYARLIHIDDKNDIALNNLGVEAKEAKVDVVSIDSYKRAAALNNTLAMANQGYALLHAGFTDEAEELANKAISLGDPHSNIYLLKTEIEKTKEKQYKDWKQLKDTCKDKQKQLRKYTEQYYKGEPTSLEGEWFVNGKISTLLSIKEDSIEGSWVEPILDSSPSTCTVKLTGKVTGSTLAATLKRIRNDKPSFSISFSFKSEQVCIGYLSDDKNTLTLTSEKMGDTFHQVLSRVNQDNN